MRHCFETVCLCLLAGLAMTGCTDELVPENSFDGSEGGRVHATLSFDMDAPAADVRTRSVLDAGGLKLETVWIGVFDTKTGEMVGYLADRPRKDDNTRVLVNDSGTWTVNGIEVWYYDSNPEVYIAAVANFEHIKARKLKAGEEVPDLVDLSELLGVTFNGEGKPEVTTRITWDDLRAISVDTKSVDTAMGKYNSSPKEQLTLAMGFFNTSAGVQTSIDHNGSTPSNARVPLTKDGVLYGETIQPEGRLYLRRLQVDVNFNIRIGDLDNGAKITKVENVRYKVMNRPTEVYLAEHATDKRGGDINADKAVYLSRTANSADFLENGYESDTDWIKAEGSVDEGGFTFAYTHYENKHWGLDYPLTDKIKFRDYYGMWPPSSAWSSVDQLDYTWENYFNALHDYFNGIPWQFIADIAPSASHKIREEKIGNTSLFRALCADNRHAYNNNASYVIIEADVTVLDYRGGNGGEEKTSHVTYTIHEGYTSQSDGSAAVAYEKVSKLSDVTDIIRDFQSIRNTKYDYYLTLFGTDYLELQATSSEYHNDGLTGTIWKEMVYEIDPRNTKYPNGDGVTYFNGVDKIFINRKNLTWRLYESGRDGNTTLDFGTWAPTPDNPGFRKWPEIAGGTLTDPAGNPEILDDPLFQAIKVRAFHFHPKGEAYEANTWTEVEEERYLSIYEFMTDPNPGYDADDITLQIVIQPFSKSGADYDELNQSMRGLYLCTESQDQDGCKSISLLGFEQRPEDSRQELVLNPIYGDNHANPLSLWCGSQYGISVIEWNPSGLNLSNPNDYLDNVLYKLKIGDVREYVVSPREYGSTAGPGPIVFPVHVEDLPAGDYTVSITPVEGEGGRYNELFRPGETYVYERKFSVRNAFWSFDEPFFKSFTKNDRTDSQGSSYGYTSSAEYYGMMVVGNRNNGKGFEEIKDGYIQTGGAGGLNQRSFSFVIDRPGTFKIKTCSTSSNTSRSLILSDRSSQLDKATVIYPSDAPDYIYLNAFDNIEFGGENYVTIYPDGNVRIYSIEFIPDEDTRMGIGGSTFLYTNYRKYTGGSPYRYIHNNAYYSNRYYIVPGFVTEFGFTDSDYQAKEKYVIGIYSKDDHEQPLFEQTFVADECRTDTRSDAGYFVCPLYVPDNGTLTRGQSYDIAVTPLGNPDKYRPGTPHFLVEEITRNLYVSVIEHDAPTWWADDIPSNSLTTPTGSAKNPFYEASDFTCFTATDSGEAWEHKGLVLHGGSSMTVGQDYITAGQGYPESTLSTGRYLSFTTAKSGKVVLTGSGNAGRYFCLYASVDKGKTWELIDRKEVRQNFASFELKTGKVEGLTDFIICTTANLNYRSIQFVASDDSDVYTPDPE